MKKIDFPKIPNSIGVDVKKGDRGVLIAELPKYSIFTEANDLNELFIQVNDLIYTYFDIPKKYHNKICFVPSIQAREKLVKMSEDTRTNTYSQFNVNTFYTEDLCRSILNA